MARTAEILVDVCAYAGTGNVLKVQQMLQACSEHPEAPKKDDEAEASPAEETATAGATATASGADADGDVAMGSEGAAAASGSESGAADAEEETTPKSLRHQAVATIGIALIAMGEDVGAEMALRHFQHLVSRR
jgi:26S proteasome regulatory subunit N1